MSKMQCFTYKYKYNLEKILGLLIFNKPFVFEIEEIVFLAEIFPLHFGLKYAGDIFSGLFPVFFIASAERTLNTLVDWLTLK